MSKTVDQRVVEMQFDNKHFETNVKTTMSTLDKLKSALKFDGAAKSLESVNAAAKSCNLNPLSQGVQTVQAKFSALQIAGITALTNITNSAVNAGKNIVSALTIQPVTTGFNEYELKMGSIQTIMASTGEDLQTVNKYLNELNEYSDQTIYSFSDMTQNIGKFTNAGVKLEDAVLAIKGISNEAAVSGANANEASRAMYNFAQALSSGYVKLIDWKSIELANMGTVEFKQQLIDAAVAAGTLTEAADGMYETVEGKLVSATTGFNDSLQDQWMTTEVLINTLKDYADANTEIGAKAIEAATQVKTATQLFDTLKESAQSGWAQTWEIIVGDFEEAKSLFTYLSNVFGDIIGKSAEARNSMLEKALGSPASTAKNEWDEYIKQINDAGVATEDFQDALLDTAKTHDKSIGEMIENGKSFEEIMKSGKLTSDMVAETLLKFADGAEEVSNSTDAANEKLEEMRDLVHRIWIKGEFGNGAERIQKLTEAGYDYAEVQALVNKVVDGGTIELSDLSDEQLESIGYTEEQIKALRDLAAQAKKTGTPIEELAKDMDKMSGREMLFATLKNIMEEIGKVIDKIKESWEKVFGDSDLASTIYDTIEALYNFIGTADIASETLTNIGTTFEGLFRVMEITTFLSNGVYKAFKKILGILETSLGIDFWGLTARIANLVIQFRNWLFSNNELMTSLKDTGNAILTFIGDTMIGIRDWIAEFMALENVQEFIKTFKDAFIESFTNLKNWILGFGTIFGDFFTAIQNIDEVSFDSILGAVKEFGKNVLNHILNLPNAFGSVLSAIQGFASAVAQHFGNAGNAVSEAVGGVFEKIKSIYEAIKTWVSENISFGGVVAVLVGIGMIVALLKIANVLNKAFVTIANVSKSVTGMFDSLGGMFKSFAKSKEIIAKSIALRNVAISIAILAASLWVIGQMEWSQIGKGMVALLVIVGMLGGLAFALNKMGKLEVQITVAAQCILALAGAVLILAVALKIMDTINPAKMVLSMVMIAAMVAGLTAAVTMLSKKAPKLSTGSLTLISLALSIGILADALKKVADLDVGNALGAFAVIMALLAGFAIISRLASKSAGSAFAIIGMVIAIRLIIGLVDNIAELDTSGVASKVDTLGRIVLLFAGLLIATKFAGRHAFSASLGLIAMAGALAIIIQVIKMLGDMDPATLTNGTNAITEILKVFALIVLASVAAGKYAMRAGAMLILMAGAMFILTGVLWIMSKMDPTGLENAVAAVQGIIVVFALLVAATKNVPSGIEKTVTMLAISIAVIAIAIGALSFIDPDKLTGATLALSAVLSMFALVAYSTKNIGKCVGALVLMNITVALLAGALWLLSDIPTERALGSAISLSALLLAFSGALLIISKSKKITKEALSGVILMSGVIVILSGALWLLSVLPVEDTIGKVAALSILLMAFSGALVIIGHAKKLTHEALGTVVVMTIVLYAIATAIAILAHLDVGSTLEIAASLSLLLLALAGSCMILSNAGPFAVRGASAALLMAGVLAILAIVLGVMAKFNVNPSLETAASLSLLLLSLSAACVILGVAGSFGPAAFVGIGVFAAMITAVGGLMVAIGALVTYIPKLEEFVNKAVPIMGAVGQGIGAFFGNLVGGFIGGIGGGAMAEYATGLSDFMTNLQPFLDGVKNIDESVLNGVKYLSDAMVALSAAGAIDAFTKIFSGDGTSGIANLSSQLVPFGEAMVDFSTTISGKIDPEAVNAAAAAGQVMATMAKEVPNTGGLLGWIMGNNDLDTFGDQLVPFGRAMVSFSNVVAGKIDQSAVEAAAAAGETMIALAKDIPNTGGLLGWIMGDNDLDDFGKQLPVFGRAMVAFSSVVAGNINQDAVNAAAAAGETMVALAKEIPNTGGLLGWIMGDNDLDDFGKQLPVFGRAMVAFSRTVSGNIDSGAVDAAAAAGQVMVELANAVPANKNDFIEFFTGDDSLEGFGKQITSFGEAMVSFSDTISGASDFSDATSAVQNAMNLADMAMELSGKEFDLEPLTGTFTSFADSLVAFSDKITGELDLDSVSIAAAACYRLSEAAALMPNEVDFAKVTNGLTQFGESLGDFSDVVKDSVDTDAVTTATDAGKSIVEMAQGIPAELDLTNFSSNVKGLAQGIKDFSTTIGEGVTPGYVTVGTQAGTAICDFMEAIPDYIDPTSFIDNAASLATAIKDFGTNTSEVNLDNVTNATTSGTSICNFIKLIPDYIDPTSFIDNVGSLALAIKDFGTNAAELDGTAVDTAVTAGNSISSFMTGIPDYIDTTDFINNAGSLSKAIVDFTTNAEGVNLVSIMMAVNGGNAISAMLKEMPQGVDVSSFTAALPQISGAISDFATEMNGVKMPDVQSIISNVVMAVNNASAGLKGVGSTMVEMIAEGLSSKTSSITTVATNIVNAASKVFSNKQSEFSSIGKALMSRFTTGLAANASRVRTVVTTTVSSAANAIKGYYTTFYNGGTYLGSGFVLGIAAKQQAAYNAGYALGQKAAQGVKDGEDSNSPSKEGIKAGLYLGEGLVIGINQMGKSVYSAGYNMGDTAAKSLSNSISKISDVINSDIDTQPTIRPVLDLSDIQSGAGLISSMLTPEGVIANVGGINSAMNRRIQNGANDDVVSAIDKLRKDVGHLENRTYSIGGISYAAGDEVSNAIETLVRAVRVEGRV